jgi:hypothetical protein
MGRAFPARRMMMKIDLMLAYMVAMTKYSHAAGQGSALGKVVERRIKVMDAGDAPRFGQHTNPSRNAERRAKRVVGKRKWKKDERARKIVLAGLQQQAEREFASESAKVADEAVYISTEGEN